MIERNMNEDLRAMLDQCGYDKVFEVLRDTQKQKEAEERARKEKEIAEQKAKDAQIQKDAQYIADLATRLLHSDLTDEDMAFIYRRYLSAKDVDEMALEALCTPEAMSELAQMLVGMNPLMKMFSDIVESNSTKKCGHRVSEPCDCGTRKVTVKKVEPKDIDSVLREFLNTL